jgi:hypothetical protein
MQLEVAKRSKEAQDLDAQLARRVNEVIMVPSIKSLTTGLSVWHIFTGSAIQAA